MKALFLAGVLLASQAPAGPDRSPLDLALSADGSCAAVANSTSDSVSLVALAAGTVVSEVSVGRRPFAVALSGSRAAVTNLLDDSVTILELPKLAVVVTIPVGDEPRGVVLGKDRAYVALAGDDAI